MGRKMMPGTLFPALSGVVYCSLQIQSWLESNRVPSVNPDLVARAGIASDARRSLTEPERSESSELNSAIVGNRLRDDFEYGDRQVLHISARHEGVPPSDLMNQVCPSQWWCLLPQVLIFSGIWRPHLTPK